MTGSCCSRPGRSRATLTSRYRVGDHLLEVDAGSLGGFVHSFSLEDRGEHSVEVQLRPRLTLLSVLAGDREATDRIRGNLDEQFAHHPDWMLVDSTDRLEPQLGEISADLEQMRAGDYSSVDWQRVQTLAGREAVGSVYMVAVLADDLLASDVDLITPAGRPRFGAGRRDAGRSAAAGQPRRLGKAVWQSPDVGAPLVGCAIVGFAAG